MHCLQEGCPNSDSVPLNSFFSRPLLSTFFIKRECAPELSNKIFFHATKKIQKCSFRVSVYKIHSKCPRNNRKRPRMERQLSIRYLHSEFLIEWSSEVSSWGGQGSFQLLLEINCKELPCPYLCNCNCPLGFGHCSSLAGGLLLFRTVSPGCLRTRRLIKSSEHLEHSSGVSMFKCFEI